MHKVSKSDTLCKRTVNDAGLSCPKQVNLNEVIEVDMRQQNTLMKYNTFTGLPLRQGVKAVEWRDEHRERVWLCNPWTGNPRDPRDILSDTQGYLIVPPFEPLFF